MGFVIHKYLSKSLKSPAPSTEHKDNSGASLSNGKALKEDLDLKIPDQAYASHKQQSVSIGPPTTTGSPVAMHRSSNRSRASMNSVGAGRRPKITLNMNDNFNRRTSLQHVSGLSHTDTQSTDSLRQSYRRPSLQHDSTYERAHNDYYSQNGSGPGYGDEDASIEVVRTQTSSTHWASSLTDVAAHLSQENRWFELELKREKKKYSQLEKKLFGTRDKLAYTNATWIDQLHAAQHKHQEEIFRSKRQAEKAENAILEKELEEWRETLTKVVEENNKLAENDSRQKEKSEFTTPSSTPKRKTTTPTSTPRRSSSRQHSSTNDTGSREEIQQLQTELEDWKDKHAKMVNNSKRIQEVLEHESAEKDVMLKEAERQVEWLEAELQTAICGLEEDIEHNANAHDQHEHTILILKHRSELEDRVQSLLKQNVQLQRGKSEANELQVQVRELEESLDKSKESTGLQKVLWTKEIEHLQKESREWEKKAQALDSRLELEATSRESIHAEFAGRLEALETENFKLRDELEKKEQHWSHQMNLKKRYIETLKSEFHKSDGKSVHDVISPSEETLSSPSEQIPPRKNGHLSGLTPSEADSEAADSATQKLLQEAQQRERALLLQVSELTQNEVKLQQRVQEAEHRAVLFESYLTGRRRGLQPPIFEGIEAESDFEQESLNQSLPTPTPVHTPTRTSMFVDEEESAPENDTESETEQVLAKTPLETIELASRKASVTSVSSHSTTTTVSQESRSSSSVADVFSSKSQSLHERLAQEKKRLMERRSKLQTAKAIAAAAPDMKTTSEKIRNMTGITK